MIKQSVASQSSNAISTASCIEYMLLSRNKQHAIITYRKQENILYNHIIIWRLEKIMQLV